MAEKQIHHMNEIDIRSLAQRKELTSELELEKASLATRILRLQSEKDPSLEQLREKLIVLIRNYETIHWSRKNVKSRSRIEESDRAEVQAMAEFEFFRKRNALILKKLKIRGLKQIHLSKILMHSKSYTSELLNGIRAFSSNDLLVIHKLLNIKLEDLFFTELPTEIQDRINSVLGEVSVNIDNKDSKEHELVT